MRAPALAAAALVAGATCKPLPPPLPPDAGMGSLRGVVFERLHGGHRQLRVEAPRADLDINGTQLLLHLPHGEAQQTVDAGLYRWRAQTFTAHLRQGAYSLDGVAVTDSEQRQLTSPHVALSGDGGVLVADPPVALAGPNFQLDSSGGARADLATQELVLLGPVEARAWPPDGGPSTR